MKLIAMLLLLTCSLGYTADAKPPETRDHALTVAANAYRQIKQMIPNRYNQNEIDYDNKKLKTLKDKWTFTEEELAVRAKELDARDKPTASRKPPTEEEKAAAMLREQNAEAARKAGEANQQARAKKSYE